MYSTNDSRLGSLYSSATTGEASWDSRLSSQHSSTTTCESVDDSLEELQAADYNLKRNGQGRGGKSQQYCAQPMRQLPCRTFLSCGGCSFNERCLFLHPPSLQSKLPLPLYVNNTTHISRSAGSAYSASDALYFPTMPMRVVMQQQTDNRPRIDQEYLLPRWESVRGSGQSGAGASYSRRGRRRKSTAQQDTSVAPVPQCLMNARAAATSYSVWHHLLNFLHGEWNVDASSSVVNSHTGGRRLDVFISLGKGLSVN